MATRGQRERGGEGVGAVTFGPDEGDSAAGVFDVPYPLLVYPFERVEPWPRQRDVAHFVGDLGRLLTSASLLLGGPPIQRQERQSMPPRVDGDRLPDGPRIDHDRIPPEGRLVNRQDGYDDPTTGKTIYGASFVFFLQASSSECGGYAVIQISRVRAERRTGDGPWEDAGTGHDWDVDGERSTTNPTSRDQRRASDNIPGWPGPADASVFSDTPGSPENPWESDDARGKTFRWTYDFETYIICRDPPRVIGYYTWGFTLELTVGTNKETTTGTIPSEPERNRPTWHTGADGGHLRDGLNLWSPTAGPKAGNALGLPGGN